MLPRPFFKRRPNSRHNKIFEQHWLCHLLQLMEQLTYDHVKKAFDEEDGVSFISIKQQMDFCKYEIPDCLRVCDTVFNQVVLEYNDTDDPCMIPLHKDEKDLISCILHLGEVDVNDEKCDGATIYHNGKNIKNQENWFIKFHLCMVRFR